MKTVVFACLLALAGASVLPQEEVSPSQERIVDLWLASAIYTLRRWIQENELDPVHVEHRKLDYVIIDGLVQMVGEVKDLHVVGLSGIYLNSASFSLPFGRLDYDIVMPRVTIAIGRYEAEGRYGSRGGRGKLSGGLEIDGLRLVGHVLLRLDPGPHVTVFNVAVRFSVNSIQADFKAAWKCLGCLTERDVTNEVNNFINVELANFLVTFQKEIDTIVGEIIRIIANRWW